jgi:integrase
MSVLKRSNSPFWYIQFQMNGKTYIKSSKTVDHRLAEQIEANWKKQLMTERVLGIKSRILLVEAVDLYMEAKEKLASARNLKRYVTLICSAFRSKQYLDEVTSNDIERLRITLTSGKYSPQTTKHVIGAIRGIWKHTKRMGYQTSDVEFPSIKTTAGKLRYLSVDEEQRLLAAIDPKRPVKGLPIYQNRPELMKKEMHDLYDLFVMLLDTGARFREIATLKWSQIDLKQQTIALWRSKVHNESLLYMTARVTTVLEGRSKGKTSEYVFTNRTNGPKGYTGTTLRRTFIRAGLPDCSAHTLRHTHATRLIQNGMTIYEVKEILGHSDIRTTMRYAHLEKKAVFRKAKDLIERLNCNNPA